MLHVDVTIKQPKELSHVKFVRNIQISHKLNIHSQTGQP